MARGRSRATYFPRTKGHSILPQRSYLYPRSTYAYDEDYVPSYRAPTRFYPGSDYYVADAMSSHATTMSTDTVYDNMDLAAKSRGKDQRLMTQVNAALAYATPSTPARARASARANRQQQKAPVYPASYYPAYSVPPEGDLGYEPVVNTDRYDRFNLRSAPRPTQRSARKVYSSGSIASKAVPRPSSGKSIRETEGYSKPKNLLSWQYRIQSYVDPTDVFYTPASVYKMRDRVRDAQEKLDLHRQMLDRYLEVDLGPGDDVAARVARKQRDLEERQPE